MEENIHIWNIKNLQPPPVNTYKITSHIDVNGILRPFENAVYYFVRFKHLEAESRVLSRIVYRSKTKLRMDKGFKCLLKLNHCLLQYLNMNFGGTVNVFHELIKKKKISYMPSRNMLDYVLVRLQGVTMLLNRIIQTSQLSAHYIEQKISRGDYWKMAVIFLSVASRIWVIARKIIKFCSRFYLNLLHFRSKIEIVGPQWIPNSYQFPNNLETWLVEHQAFEIGKYEQNLKQNAVTQLVERFSEVHTDSLTDDSSESGTDDAQNEEIQISNNDDVNNFYLMMQNDDIGKRVSRTKNSRKKAGKKLKNGENLTENTDEKVSRIHKAKKNSQKKARKKLLNGKNMTENTNAELVKIKEIKTHLLEAQNKVITMENKVPKTNILQDYFEKKRKIQANQALKHTKLIEENHSSYNSVTKESNSKLIKPETTLSKQYKITDNTSAKTEISFSENDTQNVIQKSLNEANKNRLKINIHDGNNIQDISKSINSISDLKSFIKKQALSRDHQKHCVSKKLDRLQWHILERKISKYIKKADKTTEKSKHYLLKAKDLLKVSLT